MFVCGGSPPPASMARLGAPCTDTAAHQVLQPEHKARFYTALQYGMSCAMCQDTVWATAHGHHHSSCCTTAQHGKAIHGSWCAERTSWTHKRLAVPQPKMSFSWCRTQLEHRKYHIYEYTHTSCTPPNSDKHHSDCHITTHSSSLMLCPGSVKDRSSYKLKLKLHWAVLESPQKWAVLDLGLLILNWFWSLCEVVCHQQGPPCHQGLTKKSQKLLLITLQEMLPQERNCEPWNMLVYTNAFVGSRQSSEIISSKILDLPVLGKWCGSACRTPQRGCSHQAQRNYEKRTSTTTTKKRNVEDFFQKIGTG